ncbi:MAG: UDP-4-amino-4-deoxy-L-arabinose--oxoglutarate aminotransferase [Syntrophus sp. PtaU1.Bin208]|nr:MAG: UDP-4-amino-4-deoxy-L-arabinose--oxoglutarate aminotransferase [Syntrophus sp. PtaU1.Bin208]
MKANQHNSMWKVPLFELNYDESESRAVADVLASGWITMGECTQTFERQFAEFLGSGTLVTAVSSGTAALHMAMLALGIGPGDEVIVPALTFIADVNVVRMAGAVPVTADCVSFNDWNIDPADIERKITSRTKAVMIVHYAGYPCDMDALVPLCRERGLFLVEDCAHSPGATYRGRSCGTFGDVACFSFFTNKNLSVGEGGMFVTRDEGLHQKGRYLRSHGMSTLTLDRHQGRAVSYDVLQPGLNYRIDEMRAALGCVQLKKLEAANRERRRMTERYHGALSSIGGISIPFLDHDDCLPSYHIYPILLNEGIDRLAVIESLKQRGIQSSIHYPSFKEFTAYKEELSPYATPLADEISQRELTLPLYPTMGFGTVDLVTNVLRGAL